MTGANVIPASAIARPAGIQRQALGLGLDSRSALRLAAMTAEVDR
jgi:hypothetical protein